MTWRSQAKLKWISVKKDGKKPRSTFQDVTEFLMRTLRCNSLPPLSSDHFQFFRRILRKIYIILILGATSIQKSFLIFFLTFLNFIFVAQGLCLVAVRRLSLVVVSRLWNTGSVAVAHGRSCSRACGILPDQGSNLCPCIAGWILNHWMTKETCLLIFNKTRHVLKNSQPCSGWRTMLWLENHALVGEWHFLLSHCLSFYLHN